MWGCLGFGVANLGYLLLKLQRFSHHHRLNGSTYFSAGFDPMLVPRSGWSWLRLLTLRAERLFLCVGGRERLPTPSAQLPPAALSVVVVVL